MACETCAILKEALDYERERVRELMILLHPPVVQQPVNQVTLNQRPAAMTFTKRRALLEQADRQRLEAEKNAGKSDKQMEEIAKLEEELNIKPGDSVLTNVVEADGTTGE